MSIFVVRHADAGNRAAWQADDRLRPLTQSGLEEALHLAERLVEYKPRRLLSSPQVRCVQTLEPLAAALEATIEEATDLAEGQAERAAELFAALLTPLTGDVVLCTHGDVVETLLSVLAKRYGVNLGSPHQAKKGSAWHISLDGGLPATATYLPPSTDS